MESVEHTSTKTTNSPRKRCLDRRRETSRFAARDRRGKEADIFLDLKDVVPIVDESTTATHVDRIALLRVAATLCRLRKNAAKFFHDQTGGYRMNNEVVECIENPVDGTIWSEDSLTECMDGFVIIADADGTILYVTESVSIYLGLTQTDLVGHYLKEFVHANDYDELSRAIINAEIEGGKNCDYSAVLRMKSVVSPRGRNLNLKSALYKAIMCRCQFMAGGGSDVERNYASDDDDEITDENSVLELRRSTITENVGGGGASGKLTLIYGCATPAGQGTMMSGTGATAVKGTEVSSCVYTTRHTCDMRFTYVNENLNFLLRHDARSLMGTSLYELVHPADMSHLRASMQELFRKGHCRTVFYRLLGKNGSVVWTQTEAATVNHTTRGQKGQYVLCVHSVLGTQSELDSWNVCNSVGMEVAARIEGLDLALTTGDDASAAHSAKHATVKSEIIDVAEYFGRQPEFVDCVDFTPLIEPVDTSTFMINNSAEYRVSHMQRVEPELINYDGEVAYNEVYNSNTDPRMPNAMPADDQQLQPPFQQRLARQSSFDEVLQWLFCDESESSLPQVPSPTSGFQEPTQFTTFTSAQNEPARLAQQQHHQQQQGAVFRQQQRQSSTDSRQSADIGRGRNGAGLQQSDFVGGPEQQRRSGTVGIAASSAGAPRTAFVASVGRGGIDVDRNDAEPVVASHPSSRAGVAVGVGLRDAEPSQYGERGNRVEPQRYTLSRSESIGGNSQQAAHHQQQQLFDELRSATLQQQQQQLQQSNCKQREQPQRYGFIDGAMVIVGRDGRQHRLQSVPATIHTANGGGGEQQQYRMFVGQESEQRCAHSRVSRIDHLTQRLPPQHQQRSEYGACVARRHQSAERLRRGVAGDVGMPTDHRLSPFSKSPSYALSTSPQASQTQQQQQLHLQRVHASVSPASGCRTQSLQQQYQQQEILRRQQHHQQQHRRRQNGFQNQHCDSYSPVGHHSQQRSGAVENGSSVRFNSHERQHSNRRYPQQFQSESQRPSFSPIRNHSSNVDGVSALNVNQLSTVTMPLVNAAAAAYHTTSPSPLNTKNNRLSHDYASNYSLNKHLQSDPSPPLFTAANDYDGCANGGFYDNANLTDDCHLNDYVTIGKDGGTKLDPSCTNAAFFDAMDECQEFSAKLAPFLPQDDMQELLDDGMPSLDEMTGLFPDFDASEFFPSGCGEIIQEMSFPNEMDLKSPATTPISSINGGVTVSAAKHLMTTSSSYTQLEQIPIKRARFNQSFGDEEFDHLMNSANGVSY